MLILLVKKLLSYITRILIVLSTKDVEISIYLFVYVLLKKIYELKKGD